MESDNILKPHTVFAGHSVRTWKARFKMLRHHINRGLDWRPWEPLCTVSDRNIPACTIRFGYCAIPPKKSWITLGNWNSLPKLGQRKPSDQVEQYVWRKRSQNHSACYYQAKNSSLLPSTHLDRSPGATSGVQAWMVSSKPKPSDFLNDWQIHTSSPQSFGLKQNLLNTTLRCQGTPLKIRAHQSISLYHTSSTAQGGGGSFKNRKPIGEIGCCEPPMAKQKQWIELSNCVTD